MSKPYYPQNNGQVKTTNKTIINILSKLVAKYGRDWHNQLPFSLVYDEEAVIPFEL